MKRLLSKGGVLLLFAGFTLFFFTAQISIFQVTFHVVHIGDSAVTFSPDEQTTTWLFREKRAFWSGKSYGTVNNVFKRHNDISDISVTLFSMARSGGGDSKNYPFTTRGGLDYSVPTSQFRQPRQRRRRGKRPY